MECFSGDSKLKIQTENEAVARKCFTLLQKTFNIETKIFVRENSHLKRVKVYTIEITDPEEDPGNFSGTAACHEQYQPGYACIVGYAGGTAELLQTGVYQGSFLASGSISGQREKGYHFEIVCSDAKERTATDDHPQFFGRCQNRTA